MDNKKPAHVVAIKIIKESLAILTDSKNNNNLKELKNQYTILGEALIFLYELKMSEPTRREVLYELKKLKIEEVLKIIEDTIEIADRPIRVN